jgi:hypothetical protein
MSPALPHLALLAPHALLPALPQGAPASIDPRAIVPRYAESSIGLDAVRFEGGRSEIEIGDLNADGHPDLVLIGDHGSPFVNSSEHGITVFFGDGTGRWLAVQEGDFGYGGVALGDANGDGWLDVGYGMHHNWSPNDLGDQLIEVALGNGTGQGWIPWDDGLATSGETYGMFDCDFADVDGDGDLDLACLSFGCCNGLHVYLNLGNGAWRQSFAAVGGNVRNGLVFGDVNGDGHPDLASGYQGQTAYIGDGTGGFAPADANLPPPGVLGRPGVDLGDVDGDGRDDLSFVSSGGLQVWLSVPGGWLQSGQGLPGTGSFEATQLVDLNRDGRTDLAAFGGGEFAAFLGDGRGRFRRVSGFTTPRPGNLAAFRVRGDADHNGRPDVAILAEEGGAFSSRNMLRFFRETSQPAAPAALIVRPGAGAMLRAGSARFVDWLAAVPGGQPATVGLELSTRGPDGPWTPIAAGLPDNGRFQWRGPAVASATCHLRLSVQTAAGPAVAVSRPFEIR